MELQYSLQLWRENGMGEEDRQAVEAGQAMLEAIWLRVMAHNPAIIKVCVSAAAGAAGCGGREGSRLALAGKGGRWRSLRSQVGPCSAEVSGCV